MFPVIVFNLYIVYISFLVLLPSFLWDSDILLKHIVYYVTRFRIWLRKSINHNFTRIRKWVFTCRRTVHMVESQCSQKFRQAAWVACLDLWCGGNCSQCNVSDCSARGFYLLYHLLHSSSLHDNIILGLLSFTSIRFFFYIHSDLCHSKDSTFTW